MLSLFHGDYYYVIVGLQIFCGIHSYRRGTLNRYIFWIIFLPLIGSIYYLVNEVLSNRSFRKPNIDVGAVFNPGGKLKKLEEEVRYTDTFANRIRLADAYLAAGYIDQAVEIYEASLTGAFAENEHVRMQLMVAYFEQQRYEEVIPIAKKVYKLTQFPRSKAHIAYAKSLESLGEMEQAEAEFKAMKGRFSYYGPRYEYGLFLIRADRNKDAWTVFTDMLNEEKQLSQMERKTNREWFSKARDEVRKLGNVEEEA